MERCRISVIVPVFNSEAYLERLVNSLNEQKYSNFEVIFINDGSTDNSLSLLELCLSGMSFENNLVTIPNAGPSNARNVGINIASGDYLVFIDSDDILTPLFLKKMIESVNGKYDAACCDFKYFTNEHKLETTVPTSNKEKSISSIELGLDIVLALKPLFHCCFIYKMEYIKEYGIRYMPNYTYGEDTLFLVKYLSVCQKKIVLIEDVLLLRRQREGSLTSFQKLSSNFERYINDAMCTRVDMINILRNTNDNKISKKISYVIPRMSISIVTNLALSCDNEVYLDLVRKNGFRKKIRLLLTFPDLKIVISSIIFCISPSMYRIFLRKVKGS